MYQNPREASSRSRIFLISLLYVCICVFICLCHAKQKTIQPWNLEHILPLTLSKNMFFCFFELLVKTVLSVSHLVAFIRVVLWSINIIFKISNFQKNKIEYVNLAILQNFVMIEKNGFRISKPKLIKFVKFQKSIFMLLTSVIHWSSYFRIVCWYGSRRFTSGSIFTSPDICIRIKYCNFFIKIFYLHIYTFINTNK